MNNEGWLAGYRVLDLSDHRGTIAGMILARLGADVVQVEPPEGSQARRTPPFHDDVSLFWETFGAGKRSIVCDPASREGYFQIERLAAAADIVIETGPDGLLSKSGLGWPWLRSINPRAIQVTMSGFGLDGPKAGYAESDLILWAAGGPLFGNRDANDTPLRIASPQSWLHAGLDAVGGALVALFARHRSGHGQHVEIAAQASIAQATLSAVLASSVNDGNFSVTSVPLKTPKKRKKKPRTRALDLSGSGARTRRSKWPIADGYGEIHLAMGPAGWSTNNLLAWMQEAGSPATGPAALCDWREIPRLIEAGEIDEDDEEEVRVAVAAFLAGKTKQELLEAGLARRITMAPILTTTDLLASEHLAERDVFETLDSDAGPIRVPARFAQCDALTPVGRAPRLNEHRDEILRDFSPLPEREGSGVGRARSEPNAPWQSPSVQQEGSLRSQPTPNPSLEGRGNEDAAPFEGLKVLDLSWVIAGPMIGRALADFGATVVRVESSSRLDAARVMGPFPNGVRDVQQSVLFENANAGKLGATLDLSRPEGIAALRDLAGWADVVIESFSPGTMKRWGLDYAALSAGRPGLIMVSTSLMGQTGRYSGIAGFGNIGSALAGYQHMAGQRDAVPTGPFGPYTDYVGPKFGIVTLLAALEHRRTTGEGSYIDLAQADAAIQFLGPQIALSSLTGAPADPDGNRDPAQAPHGVFRCRGDDRWVAIAVQDDHQWRQLAKAVGGRALAEDPRFATLADRKAHEDRLESLVANWASAMEAADIERHLQDLGIPAHVVAASADFCADPQIAAVGHLVRAVHPTMGEVLIENSRFRLSDTPARIERSGPQLGADNRRALRDFAGYDEARIDALDAAGILK
jgi:crotonobetainyl-CoA:carnitine CoA-transferase CaiB-like acyl-CoA transferase